MKNTTKGSDAPDIQAVLLHVQSFTNRRVGQTLDMGNKSWWKNRFTAIKHGLRKSARWFRWAGWVLAGLTGLSLLVSLAGWFYFWPPLSGGDASGEQCTRCHVVEPYLEDMNNPEWLVHDHLQEGVKCLDCHQLSLADKFQETITYLNLNGEFRNPLRRYKYPQETCLSCHEHGSYEQIALVTTDLGVTDDQAGGTPANPHQSHFAKLECHLCHRMHEQSVDYCAECHKYDWDVP